MVLSSDSDMDDGSPPRLPSSTKITSPEGPAMPAALTSAVGLVQPQDGNEWRVRAGEDLPKFLVANGPARITRYNFKMISHHHWADRATRNMVGGKPDFADIFELTSAGTCMDSTLLAWRVEMACTGESEYGKAPPNCRHVCCGGFGVCRPTCDGGGSADWRFTLCAFRVSIKATLADVAAGFVRVFLTGEHVPPWVEPVPPGLNGLKPAPFALRLLREKCAEPGAIPTRVANTAQAALGEGAERNTRVAPPARFLAGVKKRDARRARGGSMDDATRIDMLVRCHLIQRGMVLLYVPGVQLVLTTSWALERAREARMASIDAKVDVVTGARSKWTSVGVRGSNSDLPACGSLPS